MLPNDRSYLADAYRQALDSPDPSTQNGAVLVFDRWVIGNGCNRFPVGVDNTEERWNDRTLKYQFVIHAEMAAIVNAGRYGNATGGAKLVVPWFACDRCAVAIIEAGIVEVVGHRDVMEFAKAHNPRWEDSIATAMIMFEEAGVKVTWLEGPVEGVSPIRIAEKSFNPCVSLADQVG